MTTQFNYIDANNSYVDVARLFDKHAVSASPQVFDYASDYAQKLMQNNLHASDCYYDDSNGQYMSINSHASATPQIHMPMSNMMSSVNCYQTPHGQNFNIMQGDVSSYYSLATSPYYASSSRNMPMDEIIGHVSPTYPANYSHSYAAPSVTNFSAPYVEINAHNSASCLTYDHSQMHEFSASMHMPSSTSAAYDLPRARLENFGNTHVSLPKESERLGGQSQIEWDVKLHRRSF